MALTLHYQGQTSIPVEVEGITPDLVRGMSVPEIEKMEIFHGNEKVPLGEFFAVSGDGDDCRMMWEGQLRGVHWIGAKMTDGYIRILGNGGRHIGSEMTGGEIHVDGEAGDWVGGEMHGGLIHIRGSAGHLIGAAYRGSRLGMTGGTILIGGDAGNEIGHTMRRGLIAIAGNAGDLAGFNMRAGSILIFGQSGIRYGAGMRRGTIGFLGPSPPPLMPSFRYACRYRPLVLPLIFRFLQEHQFDVPGEPFIADYDLYNGDMLEGGRGEVFIRAGD